LFYVWTGTDALSKTWYKIWDSGQSQRVTDSEQLELSEGPTQEDLLYCSSITSYTC